MLPLPIEFRPRYFVLVWDRAMDAITVVSGDPPHSSYLLGDAAQATAALLRWGFEPGMVATAVSAARNNGKVQVIPYQNRIVELAKVEQPKLDWEIKETHYAHL